MKPRYGGYGGRGKKRDASESPIVEGLREAACDVVFLDQPCDLLVGLRGRNYLLEVKSPGEKLKGHQKMFQDGWRGQVETVTTLDEALRAVELIR